MQTMRKPSVGRRGPVKELTPCERAELVRASNEVMAYSRARLAARKRRLSVGTR
jgi:hypothetical protein